MSPYIFMEKNGIHIIDLNKKTLGLPRRASNRNQAKIVYASGKKGDVRRHKKAKLKSVAAEAKRLNMLS